MTISEPKPILTPDEEEDYKLHESNEWVEVENVEERRAYWQAVARNTVEGGRTDISISIPQRDLSLLKTRAAEKGMPYQTLINAILHDYVEN